MPVNWQPNQRGFSVSHLRSGTSVSRMLGGSRAPDRCWGAKSVSRAQNGSARWSAWGFGGRFRGTPAPQPHRTPVHKLICAQTGLKIAGAGSLLYTSNVRPIARIACWCLMFVGLFGNWQIVSPARTYGGQSTTASANRPSDRSPAILTSKSPCDALGTYNPSSAHAAPLSNRRQLPTVILAPDDPGLENASSPTIVSSDVPGRRIPAVIKVSALARPDLASRAVPLPEANTLAHVNYHGRRFGRLLTAEGERLLFNPQSARVGYFGGVRTRAGGGARNRQPAGCGIRGTGHSAAPGL